MSATLTVRDLELKILRRMRHGAIWARSVQSYRPFVERLLHSGEIERCRPEGGQARNMLRLTKAGERAIAPK